MARKATGEKAVIGTDGVARKRVRLLGKKHLILMAGVKADNEREVKARGDVLAEIALRMTQAKADPAVCVEYLAKLGARVGELTIDTAAALTADAIGGWRPGSTKPTFREVVAKWQSGELARRFPDHVEERKAETIRQAQALLDKYILPIIGHLPVDVIDCKADLNRIRDGVAHIPRAGSRRQALQPLKTVLDICVQPLGLIERTPMPEGWMPKNGKTRSLQWLRPHEDAQLMACTEIPLEWRVLWGTYVRCGRRLNELLHMVISQFDFTLGTGTVFAHQQKTASRVWFPLDVGTVEGLQRFARLRHAGADTSRDRFFVQPDGRPINSKTIKLPELLRRHCQLAGIDRVELYTTTKTSRQLVVHDLRASCVTVLAALGFSDNEIMAITGHESAQELKKYKRDADVLARIGIGEGWEPLHLAIPELRALGGDAAEFIPPTRTRRGQSGHALATTPRISRETAGSSGYIVQPRQPLQLPETTEKPMITATVVEHVPAGSGIGGQSVASLQAEVERLQALIAGLQTGITTGISRPEARKPRRRK